MAFSVAFCVVDESMNVDGRQFTLCTKVDLHLLGQNKPANCQNKINHEYVLFFHKALKTIAATRL